MSTGRVTDREIVWAAQAWPSIDYCVFGREENGWVFTGIMVVRLNSRNFGLRYEIRVDREFKTESTVLAMTASGLERRLEVERREGIWFVDGKERNDLSGCVDIDLEASPVTNTLPIRRSRLEIGQRVDLTAAWLRIPSLKIEPLKQSYERLSENLYRYQTVSGFSAELAVDRFGLVTRYGNIWSEVP